MLEALGIDDVQAKVYRSLLAAPAMSVDDIVEVTGLAPARAGEIVGELEELGLLARPAVDADRFIAAPPTVALRPLLHERERGLSRAHAALAELSELYRVAADRRGPFDVVDGVQGADAVRQRILQIQAGAMREVRMLVLSEVAVMTAEENVEEKRALARGVRYRIVVENGVLNRPGFIDEARACATAGPEIRVVPSLPTRLFIVDDTLALVPVFDQAGVLSGGLVLHPSGLLDLTIAIFDEYWAAGTEFFDDGGMSDGHDQVDRELLKLLLLGLTDAAAAHQLGISTRTVQRRVADLMDTARVETRMQLGAAAVRRGWV